jgi:RHS repeat-associated protein
MQNASGAPIATTTHTYDALGRQASSQSTDNGGQVLSEYAWDYNDRHDVSAIHVTHLNAHFTIGIDARGRVSSVGTLGNNNGMADPPAYENQLGELASTLESAPSTEISVTPKAMLAVPARTSSYAYSPGGNRASQTVNAVTTTYDYNSANQLTTETAPNRTVDHTYDEWGNETLRKTTEVVDTPTGPDTQVTTETFGYNHLNMMSTYSNSKTGALWQYDYYPSGERYGKTDLNTGRGEVYATRFGDVVAEYDRVTSASDVAITPKNTYVQGLGIDSKSLRVAADGARRHYLTDRVGTVGMTLDDTGLPAEMSIKDPWGQTIAGGTNERYGGVAQREIDSESGLIYMRHRMYDPKLGRFTQTDPVLSRRPMAHYTYASGAPIDRVDPYGLWDWKSFWEGARGVVTEPYDIIQDVTRLTGAKILGMDPDDVELKSGLALRQKQRVDAGHHPAAVAVAGAIETTASVFTGGATSFAQSQYVLWKAYDEGKITPEQYDQALSRIAGGSTASAALAAVVSKSSGSGWTGKDVKVDSNLPNQMAKNVVEGRVEAGKSNVGDATFAQAARVDGAGKPVELSPVAESTPAPNGVPGSNPAGHAEPTSLGNVGAGGRVVVVDQVPCGNCLPGSGGIFGGSIWGAIRVFVTRNPGASRSPKSAAIRSATRGTPIEATPHSTIPYRPVPVVPLAPDPDEDD